jgi:penicillin-binding protein-related factor A (putative recombinase)
MADKNRPLSQRVTERANKYYLEAGKANIKRNEAYTRFFRDKWGDTRLMFVGSSELDYSGPVAGGQYISIEVKETASESLSLHPSKMQGSQIDHMFRNAGLGCNCFLLVWFSTRKEWYRLDWEQLKPVLDDERPSIPLRYFQAFGKLVPWDKGFPDYLSPELHPQANNLKKDYPAWMPKAKTVDLNVPQLAKKQLPPRDNLDLDARARRITEAMVKGSEAAERRNIKVSVFKGHQRDQ